ncbi:hypothetical protein V5O48_014668 [Marasmius crinis-equi]|uniref:Myb/SANT-like domain-containing protein n=1 Tax=Marasmius crinis-equi TaxID=585013 RepID=A0ABR3EWM7_9AGAR
MAKQSATSAAALQTDSEGSGRADWAKNPDAVKALVASISNYADLGGKSADKNFKPQVYSNVARDLAKAGYAFDAKQIKSKWTKVNVIPVSVQRKVKTVSSPTWIQLKKDTRIVKHLRSLSGFGWDDVKKVVTAEDTVWKGILFHPDGSKKKNYADYNYFRTNSFPYYDDMIKLMGDTVAVGDQAFSSAAGDSAPSLDAEDEKSEHGDETEEATTQSMATEEASERTGVENSTKDGSQLMAATITSISKKHTSTPPSTPPAKRVRPTSSTQIGRLVTTVEKLAGSFVSPSKAAMLTPVKKRKELAWTTIKKEEGLSPESLATARVVLRGGPDVIDDYLSFDAEDEDERLARSAWLTKEMAKLNKVDFQ